MEWWSDGILQYSTTPVLQHSVFVKTLIIGYGNQSRRDDGVGWFVLKQLAALDLPNVELETGQQLEVEAAETISRFDAVIFVDAAIPEAPEPVQRTVVTPNFQGHAVAHYLTPADVLSLCQTLYHRSEEHTSELQSPMHLVC